MKKIYLEAAKTGNEQLRMKMEDLVKLANAEGARIKRALQPTTITSFDMQRVYDDPLSSESDTVIKDMISKNIVATETQAVEAARAYILHDKITSDAQLRVARLSHEQAEQAASSAPSVGRGSMRRRRRGRGTPNPPTNP